MSFEAIRNLYPQVTNFDEKYGYFDVDGKEVKIDSVRVDKEVRRLQDEYDANQYQRDRVSEYPPIGDQLDMIYKDMKNGTTSHAEAVEAVKTKYPKG